MDVASPSQKLHLLRVALLANAIFSLTTGSGLILFSPTLASMIGGELPPLLIAAIGAGLLPFGVFVAWLGSRREPDTLIALLVSVADLCWVAGSGLLLALAYRHLNPTGVVLVLVVALTVLGFAIGQICGIRRIYSAKARDRTRFRVCFDIASDGDAAAIWHNLANLGEIVRFAPMLSESRLLDGGRPTPGVIRTCVDRNNRRWSERCTMLDHERRELVMEFLTHEPGFPFPFREMTGGWSVQPEADGARVRVWWEGRSEYPVFDPLTLSLLARQARRQFPAMVSMMSGHAADVRSGARSVLTVAPC